ncbi:MAG: dihydroorotase [Polaromonas sp.]|nr:dihydroorotase [Polaromonas sp.]
MKILIKNGRVMDPASNFDAVCDVAIAGGRIVSIGHTAADFVANKTIDATGCIVAPGLIDLSARLREPGYEHEGMLESELAAAVAGGITSLVCPPDTDPVLDEPGLVEMLKFRAEKLHQSRVFPLGALTRGLNGEALTEMVELTESGCVGFSQAEVPLANTQVLLRAMQYAASFGYSVWLRPQELYLGKGVAASGALATRLGLGGVPVAAETIALHTIFELTRATGARVHICRVSSAAGVALVAQAKADGLNVTCDVSINSLHLTDADIGYFDSRMRLRPPLRQQRDRDALRLGLLDGTIDALVSDHTPVDEDAKTLPFAEAEPGATGLELLLSLALKWGQENGQDTLMRTLQVLTSAPAGVLGASLGTLASSAGQIVKGGVADVCVFDPSAEWTPEPTSLRSQGKHTPFSGHHLQGRVRYTLVGGHVAFQSRADT